MGGGGGGGVGGGLCAYFTKLSNIIGFQCASSSDLMITNVYIYSLTMNKMNVDRTK